MQLSTKDRSQIGLFVSSNQSHLLHLLTPSTSENLEYNLVKSIIKEHTTAGGAKAISIPGQGNAVEHAFEDKVLKTLVDNHNRISLFVKSKCGEIELRLSTLFNKGLCWQRALTNYRPSRKTITQLGTRNLAPLEDIG